MPSQLFGFIRRSVELTRLGPQCSQLWLSRPARPTLRFKDASLNDAFCRELLRPIVLLAALHFNLNRWNGSPALLGERVTAPQSIVDLAAISCRQFVGSDCSRERIVASEVGLRSRFKCASSVVLAKAFSRCSMAPRCCFMALSRKQIFVRSLL